MNDHPFIRRTRLIFPIVVLVGILALSLIGSGIAQATNTDNLKTLDAQACGAGGEVTNTNTAATFCDIQAAINDAATLNGHVLSLSAGTFSGTGNQNIAVTKEVTIQGQGPGVSFVEPGNANFGFNISSNNVTITGLTIQGASDAIRFSSGGTVSSTVLEAVWLVDNVSHGVHIMGNTNIVNLEVINGSQITGNVVGFGVDAGTSFNGLLISDTTFDNDDFGVHISTSGVSGPHRNLDITDNSQFSNHGMAAIHVEELTDSAIRNNVFTNNVRGVDINASGSTAGISNVNVQNNTFSGSLESSIMLVVNGIGLGSFTAEDNTINQDVSLFSSSWGVIDVQLESSDEHGKVKIDGNNITLSGALDPDVAVYAIRIAGSSDDVDIANNTLLGGSLGSNNAVPPTTGVLIVTDEGFLGPMSTSARVFVRNGNIHDFVVGVGIWDAASAIEGGVPATATVSINQNNITGNGPDAAGHGVRNGTTGGDGLINAACNWWGDANGPGIVGPGGGDHVTANVVFSPWLLSEAPDGSCTAGPTGNLEVVKTVNWGEGEPYILQFEICLEGPQPSNAVNPCLNIGAEGGTLLFTDLPAGEYLVYETDPLAEPPGASWEVIISIGEGTVSVEPGTTPSVDVINNYIPPASGTLEVTKVVNWNGVTPDDLKIFEICITGPSPDTTVQCQNAGSQGGTLTFSNLAAGSYAITETDPGSNWSTVIATSPVSVAIGQLSTATVTNTHLLGSAEILKVVEWGETTPDEGQTFEICISGPENRCDTVDFDGGTVTFSNLLPGDYTVSETNPGTNWTTVISVNPITVVAGGQAATSTVTNTYNPPVEPGSLVVTKVVEWGETTPDEAQVFQICITGPSPSTNQLCGEADFDGGDVTFLDLQPGDYTISETDPGANWTVVISPNPVSVASGQAATATVTNTYNVEPNPGSLVVTKVVDWGTSEPDLGQTFEICITGPENRCDTVDYDGGDITFAALIAGDYTISETDPGANWTTTISPNPVSVADGQTATATVTNVYEESDIPAECLGIRIDNVIYGTEGTDRGAQAIYGTEGNDLIFGLGGHDDIFGLGGDDCIFGGDGHDYIEGNDGNDLIFGGDGMDNIVGGAGNDFAEGNGDDDFIEGNEGNDRLFGNDGSDCIFGGADNDYIEGNAGSDAPLVGNGGDDIMYGGDGHDQLYGDGYDGFHPTNAVSDEGIPGNDQLFGEAGSDYFDGGPGNDIIDGGLNSDNMFGGPGDDTLTGGDASDAFFGNGGFDTATDFDGNIDWICQSVEFGCDGPPPPTDSDGDGVPDAEDLCHGYDDNVDVDGDGIPDGCDDLIDSDGDGVADADDLCPGFDDAIDVDGDGIPDGCDDLIDSDGDGVADADDLCPGADDTVDVDGDGIPDCADDLIDSDGDGIADVDDVCPSDPVHDAVGDPCNHDEDGDGSTDDADCNPTDGSIYPGATEIPNDGIDQDCDGSDLVQEVDVTVINGSACDLTVSLGGTTVVVVPSDSTVFTLLPGNYTITATGLCAGGVTNFDLVSDITIEIVGFS